MRWRLIDRVDTFEPWTAISGRKTVSFEGYSLLAPFGLRGRYPASMVMGSCVELAAWLVAASSDFALTGRLSAVHEISFDMPTGPGGVMELTAEVEGRTDSEVHLACRVSWDGAVPAGGRVSLALMPSGETHDRASLVAAWEELHGPA